MQYLCDVSEISWHAGNANTNSIGIAFAGTYSEIEPSALSRAAFDKLVVALNAALHVTLGVQGHRDVMQTECPGDKLYAAVVKREPNFAQRLLAAADQRDLALRNKDAALYKRMLADGYEPTSEEFDFTDEDRHYVAQVGRKAGARLVFFCLKGQWDKIDTLVG